MIEELEKLAKEAVNMTGVCSAGWDCSCPLCKHEYAANPETILKLIAVVKAAKGVFYKEGMALVDWECASQMREALKALEETKGASGE